MINIENSGGDFDHKLSLLAQLFCDLARYKKLGVEELIFRLFNLYSLAETDRVSTADV